MFKRLWKKFKEWLERKKVVRNLQHMRSMRITELECEAISNAEFMKVDWEKKGVKWWQI